MSIRNWSSGRSALVLAVALSMICPSGPAAAAERTMRIGDPSSQLAGTLNIPQGAPAGPAVLLLAGSGPTDRNGSTPAAGLHPDTLRLLAEELARAGYRSLRVDKRCIGESQLACPGEATLKVETYAADAAEWTRRLAEVSGVTCVVILGHSEGALVGALAARNVPLCGYISVAGMGRSFRATIEDQIARSGASPEVLDAVRAIDDSLEKGARVENVPPALAGLFRPSVQPYVTSLMQADPRKAIANVKAPVLILQGDADTQVGTSDARALATALPTAELKIIPGVNHMLKQASVGQVADPRAYTDPVPLAAGVSEPIVDFLRHKTKRPH